jgi:hypothetical protein
VKFNTDTAKAVAIFAGTGLVLFLAWKIYQAGVGKTAAAVTRGLTQAAGGAVTGAVTGAGTVVGIPLTDAQRCAAAKAAGNKLDASLYCPAGDFLKWLVS